MIKTIKIAIYHMMKGHTTLERRWAVVVDDVIAVVPTHTKGVYSITHIPTGGRLLCCRRNEIETTIERARVALTKEVPAVAQTSACETLQFLKSASPEIVKPFEQIIKC